MILKDLRKSRVFKKDKLKIVLVSYFILTFSGLVFLGTLFFQTSFWDNKKNDFIKRIHLNGVYNYKYIPNIIYSTITNFTGKIETINININQKNKLILEKNRKEKIFNSDVIFETAKANLTDSKGKRYSTDIRLKGDRPIHYNNIETSSYKVNLDKNNFIYGMKSFSIQKPRIRNYINEWIFHELSGELNLVKLKYEFINLKINGEDKGLYVVEEGFSNNLIERNSRRAGPIFGLHEDFPYGSFKEAKLDPYQKKYWTKSSNLDLYLIAKNKILDFKERNKTINGVLDIKKWADYFALCDLLYTHHGYVPKSVKFYYNPVSALIEPIPFDGHKMPGYNYHKVIDEVYNKRTVFDRVFLPDKWFKNFFLENNGEINTIFFTEYLKSLEKITDSKFIDNFLEKKIKHINQINAKIYLDSFVLDYPTTRSDGIGIYYFDKNEIYNRATFLKSRFSPILQEIFVEDTSEYLSISNKSYINERLAVKEIHCDKKLNGKFTNHNILVDENVKFGEQKIKKPKIYDQDNNKILLICKSLLLEDKINNKIYKKQIDINFKAKKNDTFESKNFLKYFSINKNFLFLKNNNTIINENIYIPPFYTVILKQGQKINLIDNAFIFSDSNFIAKGTSENKISILGTKDNFGGGIIIRNSDNNEFKFVEFQYLKGLDFLNKTEGFNLNPNGYIQTLKKDDSENIYINKFISNPDYSNYNFEYRIYGALNFYNSKIKLNNLAFKNIASEDALNIINSKFTVNNCEFLNIFSDAIDVDFSQGKILNSKFKYILNDAIDLSGSTVSIKNIDSSFVEDKTISSGENSKANISNLIVNKAFIGIANKDGSEITAYNIILNDVEVPFTAYIKKPAYNKSKMSAKKIKIINSRIDYLISKDQILILENKKKRKNLSNKKILKIIYEQDKTLLNKI